MANTSARFMLQTLSDILSYANGTGSVNFYMAHGGSNFGYWAGAPPLLNRSSTLLIFARFLTKGRSAD
jgi:hypothetical protein